MATLKTLVSFDGADGQDPQGSLIADANGDLFGTTIAGGADGQGTVFEIAPATAGAGPTASVLLSFNGPDGSEPNGGLITDAHGDLFGTAAGGGAEGGGPSSKIVPGLGGFTPSTILLNDADGIVPLGSLTADANGNLFGTTSLGGGPNDDGTVFELAKTATGYASTPTVLLSFNGTDGESPGGTLTTDAYGDLFGTTQTGGTGDGTIFELSPGVGGETLSTISFNGVDGAFPNGSLVTDANGDLFGTTGQGGAHGLGTVFEIVRTATGYAAAPTVLASFDGADGEYPVAGLIVDAKGDLFGTTAEGGAGPGTVFEIAKTATGYAATPTVLAAFDGGTDGAEPVGSLVADAKGDLFGTTETGGASGHGTVFEITDSGYVVCFLAGTRIATPEGGRAIETLRAGDLVLTDDGTERPVRWLGRQTVATRFADAFRVAPIRIRAGALAENLPARDLLVSPDHALMVGGVFVQAGALVNGVSITREDAGMPERLVYFHVELADHALILAEGVPAETFIDNVDRLAFDNWDEHEALGGDAPMTEMTHARAKSHRQVPRALRTQLMARAVELYGNDVAALA